MGRNYFKAKRHNWRGLPEEEWWVEGAVFDGKENSYIFTNVKVTDNWEDSEIGADMIGYIVDPETICQYTGKEDRYAAKIFENDIVKEKYGGCTGVIKFGEYEEGYGYYIEWLSEEARLYKENLSNWMKEVALEVVGSVFDDKEKERKEDISMRTFLK